MVLVGGNTQTQTLTQTKPAAQTKNQNQDKCKNVNMLSTFPPRAPNGFIIAIYAIAPKQITDLLSLSTRLANFAV
jgi:hypothetical protein